MVVDYTMSDNNGASSTATATITVTGSNDVPIVSGGSITVVENSVLSVPVLQPTSDGSFAFDIDASDVLSVQNANVIAGLGSASIVGSQVVWNPGTAYDYLAVGETAQVAVEYTVSDGNGGDVLRSLIITVTGTNDAPVAVADTAATTENAAVTIDVLANDTDVDLSDTHTLDAAAVLIGHGTASIVGNQLVWTPGADYDYLAVGETATVVVDYTMSDNNGGTANSTATITVTGSNDAPVAVANTYATNENAVITGNVLTDDTGQGVDGDVDASDVLSVAAGTFTTANGASVVLNADGSFSYDPTGSAALNVMSTGQNTIDSFDYTITDGNGGTSTATATINVAGVTDNIAPTAVNDNLDSVQRQGDRMNSTLGLQR